MSDIGRNDPCHCGSKIKYKKCCLDSDGQILSMRRPAKLPMQFWHVPIGYKFIWGQSKTFNELVQLVSKQPDWWMTSLLCRMNFLLWRIERSKRLQLQVDFADKLIADPGRHRARKALIELQGKMPFISENQLWILLRAAILKSDNHAKDMPGNLIEVGEALLIANDFTEANRSSTPESLFSFLVRNILLNNQDTIDVAFVRSYYLIEVISKRLPDGIDLSEKFKEFTGVSFKKYLACIFAMWTHWYSNGETFNDQREINLEEFFSKLNVTPEELKIILDRSVLEHEDYCVALQKEITDLSKSQYDVLTFINHPLISFGKKWCWPISVKYLGYKLGHTLYWDLHDGFRARGGRLDFTNFFGRVYEEYILELFKTVFPKGETNVRMKGKKNKGDGPEIDLLFRENDTAIIIEIKSSRLNLKATKTGDIAAFDEDLAKTILEPAEQITNSGAALKAGQMETVGNYTDVKKIWPIVVCFAPFPQENLIWDRIRKKLNDHSFLGKELFAPLTILDVTDIENYLDRFREKGCSYFLEKKMSDPLTKPLTFRNFMWEKDGKRTPRHPIIVERIKFVSDILIQELFPRGSSS